MNLKDAANRLLDALKAESYKSVEVVPKGWFTSAQLASQLGIKTNWMNSNLRILIEAGKYESKLFRIKSGSRIFPIPHYREVVSRKLK